MKRIRFYKWSCGTWTIHHCANNETNTLTFDKARHYIDEIVIQLPNYLIKIEKMKQKYFVNVLGTLCNWQLTGGGNNSLALTSSQSRGAGSRAQSCCSNFVRYKPSFTFTLFFAKAPFWTLTFCSLLLVTRI